MKSAKESFFKSINTEDYRVAMTYGGKSMNRLALILIAWKSLPECFQSYDELYGHLSCLDVDVRSLYYSNLDMQIVKKQVTTMCDLFDLGNLLLTGRVFDKDDDKTNFKNSLVHAFIADGDWVTAGIQTFDDLKSYMTMCTGYVGDEKTKALARETALRKLGPVKLKQLIKTPQDFCAIYALVSEEYAQKFMDQFDNAWLQDLFERVEILRDCDALKWHNTIKSKIFIAKFDIHWMFKTFQRIDTYGMHSLIVLHFGLDHFRDFARLFITDVKKLELVHGELLELIFSCFPVPQRIEMLRQCSPGFREKKLRDYGGTEKLPIQFAIQSEIDSVTALYDGIRLCEDGCITNKDLLGWINGFSWEEQKIIIHNFEDLKFITNILNGEGGMRAKFFNDEPWLLSRIKNIFHFRTWLSLIREIEPKYLLELCRTIQWNFLYAECLRTPKIFTEIAFFIHMDAEVWESFCIAFVLNITNRSSLDPAYVRRIYNSFTEEIKPIIGQKLLNFCLALDKNILNQAIELDPGFVDWITVHKESNDEQNKEEKGMVGEFKRGQGAVTNLRNIKKWEEVLPNLKKLPEGERKSYWDHIKKAETVQDRLTHKVVLEVLNLIPIEERYELLTSLYGHPEWYDDDDPSIIGKLIDVLALLPRKRCLAFVEYNDIYFCLLEDTSSNIFEEYLKKQGVQHDKTLAYNECTAHIKRKYASIFTSLDRPDGSLNEKAYQVFEVINRSDWTNDFNRPLFPKILALTMKVLIDPTDNNYLEQYQTLISRFNKGHAVRGAMSLFLGSIMLLSTLASFLLITHPLSLPVICILAVAGYAGTALAGYGFVTKMKENARSKSAVAPASAFFSQVIREKEQQKFGVTVVTVAPNPLSRERKG